MKNDNPQTPQNSNVIPFRFQKVRKIKMMSKTPNPPKELKKWFIKYRLQNGLEGCYPISAVDKNYLFESLPNLCEEKGVNFFEFDSLANRILIQSSQLVFFQFLFEPLFCESSHESNKDSSDSSAMKIYFTDNPNPMIIRVETDEPDPEDEGNRGEINSFLYYACNLHEERQLLHLTDEDGETAFFRGDKIALVEVPRALFQSDEEDISKEK